MIISLFYRNIKIIYYSSIFNFSRSFFLIFNRLPPYFTTPIFSRLIFIYRYILIFYKTFYLIARPFYFLVLILSLIKKLRRAILLSASIVTSNIITLYETDTLIGFLLFYAQVVRLGRAFINFFKDFITAFPPTQKKRKTLFFLR